MHSGEPRATGPANDLHLGFGSFQFQITDAAPDFFTGAEYLDWITSALRRIPGATLIDLTVDPESANTEFWRPTPLESYSKTGYAIPLLSFTDIKFALHIAGKEQEHLHPGRYPAWSTLGEDFIVRIQDGWQMPIAMVWPVDSKVAEDASAAVILVREFLAREFKAIDLPIRFEILGPSPAHFTVELQPGEPAQADEFEVVGHESFGYRLYTCTYHPDIEYRAFVADRFHEALRPELDFEYRVHGSRALQLQKWWDVQEGAEEILDAYKKSTPSAVFKRVLQGRRIKRTLIALAEVELNQTQDLQSLQREFEEIYEGREATYIKHVVQDGLRRFEPIPVEPMSSLLELLDSRRQTARGIAIAAVASLIGAIVAAVATLAAK